MAEIQENNNKEKKGNKQKKMNIRVDFTPMVDMNMLLITFFIAVYFIEQAANNGNQHAIQ